MVNFLVSGLINIETTLKVDQFPLEYFPVTYPFHGIQSTISGVGFNLAKALTILGNHVNLLSLIGIDFYEAIVRKECSEIKINDQYLLAILPQTAQSVILYEKSGRRQIHTDLKDIQEQQYPGERFEQAALGCDLCILCNINFNRHLLKMAASLNKMIATDVHAIQNLEDPYNRDFMAAADILFLSHENLTIPPQAFNSITLGSLSESDHCDRVGRAWSHAGAHRNPINSSNSSVADSTNSEYRRCRRCTLLSFPELLSIHS